MYDVSDHLTVANFRYLCTGGTVPLILCIATPAPLVAGKRTIGLLDFFGL